MKYYAFTKYGTKPIAGPFRTRLEATEHGAKTGGSCIFCGKFSGGMDKCRECLCAILSGNPVPPPPRPRKPRILQPIPITSIFCTC